jgi:hypothetical protein
MGSMGIWVSIAISNLIGIIAIIWIKYGKWAKAII